MRLPVILQPDAQTEFDAAFDWYEDQRPGLGIVFAERIQEIFDRIAANPRIHAIVLRGARKAVARQFPYIVIYREERACVRVLAVFHAKRDPGEWHQRV